MNPRETPPSELFISLSQGSCELFKNQLGGGGIRSPLPPAATCVVHLESSVEGAQQLVRRGAILK